MAFRGCISASVPSPSATATGTAPGCSQHRGIDAVASIRSQHATTRRRGVGHQGAPVNVLGFVSTSVRAGMEDGWARAALARKGGPYDTTKSWSSAPGPQRRLRPSDRLLGPLAANPPSQTSLGRCHLVSRAPSL